MEDIIQYAHKKAKSVKVAAKTSMFGGSKKEENVVSEEEKLAIEFERQYREEMKKNEEVKVVEKSVQNFKDRAKRQPPNDTDIDLEMKKIKQIELEYEKEQIKNEISSAIESFDTEISDLQKEKYLLESDLKQAEMKLITYFEELIILKSLDERDQELTNNLAECRKQKGHMLKDINAINRELKNKNIEIQNIKEKEDEYLEKFHQLCPPTSPLYNEIYAYYSKIMKLKSVNRPEGAEDGDDMDEDEEDLDEEEDDEDNEASYKFNQEEHKIDDIDRLRESRSELYVKRQKIETEVNQLQNKLNRLQKDQEGIKRRLENTEKDIQRFQKFKMSKLNQLMVSVVLKISQIQNLEKDEDAYAKWEKYREEHRDEENEGLDSSAINGMHSPGKGDHTRKGKHMMMHNMFHQEHHHEITEDWRGYYMPQDLSDTTLFTHEGLKHLLDRKKELDQQISLNHDNYKKKVAERRNIKKLIEEHEKEKKKKLEEYNEKQMLRFGSLIDLDSLEVSGPSQQVIELRNKLLRVEKDCMRRREESEADFEQTQRELTKAVKENTGLLDLIISLGQEKIKLDEMLDETKQAILEDENDDEKQKIVRTKQELRQVLQLQARKIETLKTEINLYKRKGGHIYTKVTTNRRNANLNQNE